ncbi:MAG: hypothetical protein KAT68_00045 [Bacteroidales bacterium]|nr:hypothetical protein [Bacteroidales bacterium]
MKIIIILNISILFFLNTLLAQEADILSLKQKEDTLKLYFSLIKNSSNDDEIKEINNNIIKIMENVLTNSLSFDYPFDSLNYMGKLKSPDKLFRIYNWNLNYNDGSYEYFGYIQYYDKKKKEYNNYQLIDLSEKIDDAEFVMLNYQKWYGALYYKIIPVKFANKKYYTLLGWDGNNDYTNKKIIEILYFSKSGKPYFGKNIFKIKKIRKKRIIFEYANMASMTLRYDDKLKMIVFDHLSPSKPIYKEQYEYYGPDFSYDGLFFKNGKWNFVSDIDVRNQKVKNKKKKNISYSY